MKSLPATRHTAELQYIVEQTPTVLSRLLRYPCVLFAALHETRTRNRPLVGVENYTIYCGDADEKKVGGCAMAVRNDHNTLVEEFGSTSSRCFDYVRFP
ncbi:hypothetical protein RB195_023682 [Necator americanus]|uniref:Uncharacterized protein n=1 Tax=Necator americanus TaxID=51031 RepID=A0ABR1EKP3_NECAM